MSEAAKQHIVFETMDSSLSRPDGAVLHVQEWFNRENPGKDVVLVFHGLAEHCERYSRFAHALVVAGYYVVALDCRGHGKSLPDGALPGYFAEDDGWNVIVEDAVALIQQTRQRFAEGRLILFAHSMGSYVAQCCLPKTHSVIDGLVLSGSADGGGALGAIGAWVSRFEAWRTGGKKPSSLLDSMSFDDFNRKFRPNRTAFDWLSRDEAEVDLYVNDPLCGYDIPSRTWRDLLVGLVEMDKGRQGAGIRADLPVMLVTGARDPANNMAEGARTLKRKYDRAGLTSVKLNVYGDARHELLNESNREEVTADIIEWMKAIPAKM